MESVAFVAKDDQCSADLLLGNDTISQFADKVSIDYKVREITFDQEIIPIVTLGDPNSCEFSAPVYLLSHTTLKPYTDNVVMGSIRTSFPNKWEFLAQDDPMVSLPYGIAIGKEYDENGHLKKWLEKEFQERFRTRADCFEKQYNTTDVLWYKNGMVRFQLHCTRTSLKGMKQMIALDTHSLESLRVNNVLANIPEFSETFNCAPGTRMNPEKRCSMGACRSQASQYVHGFRHWTDPNKVTISENRQIQVLYKKIERRQTARAEGEGQEGKSKEKTGQTVQKFNALGILCCLTYSTVCIVVVAAV
ncbi:hypothetical protein Y032_0055g2627 [Ancylostoma ceylanicum]|uniref:Peptidase M13 C-terminal domain-containing protein n=1 Tax=Ancylostoma ceylanicum TaxID=53326 RepID=A0A016U607_9BILA|nr:hypothetical protein Y032_0055g2627 [Ancylostoma ceylanicum]